MPMVAAVVNRVALVVPCFNEQTRLAVDTFRSAHLAGGTLQLVFVDDGSTDETRAVLEKIRDERPDDTLVVTYDQNRGKAEAVRRGVLRALGLKPQAVGFWDADLATPLAELPVFVSVFENPDIDIVIGSRVKLMGRAIQRRAWRHYLGRVFATAASLTLGLPVYDTQAGAKLFRVTPVVEQVFSRPFLSRWVFDVEILARFLTLDPRGADVVARSIYELPLRSWVDVSGSKIRPKDFARAAVDLAMIRKQYGMRPRLVPPAPGR